MMGSVLWSPWSLFFLLIAISVVALYEYYTVFIVRGFTPFVISGILSGFLVLLVVFMERQSILPQKFLLLTIVPVVGLWFSFIFVRRTDMVQSLIITVTGLLYIILPLSLILFLTRNQLTGFQYNPEILIGTLFIIWTYDTGAYISGILLGKHKMAPSISPKKSWEGFFGGMIFAVLVAYIFSEFTDLLNFYDWIILSIIIVLTGTVGDLFESLLKREAGVKDSGKIMPGHGGILDRFDSILMITPFVFLYIYLIKI